MHSRTIKILLTVFVLGAGIGVLLYSSMADAEFYKHVEEVMANPGQWTDKALKVHGKVEPGSIREEIVDQTTKREFVLESGGRRIKVRHEGPKPDTFRDLSEVVARGRLILDNGEYVVIATELMAKCPSKYEENQRTSNYGKQPAARPKTNSGGGF